VGIENRASSASSAREAYRAPRQGLGKIGDAISAEVSRGRALGYYIERRESGAPGTFQAKTREEADRQLEETIAKIAAKQAIERRSKSPAATRLRRPS